MSQNGVAKMCQFVSADDPRFVKQMTNAIESIGFGHTNQDYHIVSGDQSAKQHKSIIADARNQAKLIDKKLALKLRLQAKLQERKTK